MTSKQIALSTRLQRLGFTKGNRMRLYGELLEFQSEPIIMSDEMVVMEATEKKTGQAKKVRVPLPIVNMASIEQSAA